jgi:hypothetical protein
MFSSTLSHVVLFYSFRQFDDQFQGDQSIICDRIAMLQQLIAQAGNETWMPGTCANQVYCARPFRITDHWGATFQYDSTLKANPLNEHC